MFENLRIQPISYYIYRKEPCNHFVKVFLRDPNNSQKAYIGKPNNALHGDGMQRYTANDYDLIENDYQGCKRTT